MMAQRFFVGLCGGLLCSALCSVAMPMEPKGGGSGQGVRRQPPRRCCSFGNQKVSSVEDLELPQVLKKAFIKCLLLDERRSLLSDDQQAELLNAVFHMKYFYSGTKEELWKCLNAKLIELAKFDGECAADQGGWFFMPGFYKLLEIAQPTVVAKDLQLSCNPQRTLHMSNVLRSINRLMDQIAEFAHENLAYSKYNFYVANIKIVLDQLRTPSFKLCPSKSDAGDVAVALGQLGLFD